MTQHPQQESSAGVMNPHPAPQTPSSETPAKPTPKQDEVFSINELVEAIVLGLDDTTLVRSTRVNKTFKAIITRTKRYRQIQHLEPIPGTEILFFNMPPLFYSSDLYSHIECRLDASEPQAHEATIVKMHPAVFKAMNYVESPGLFTRTFQAITKPQGRNPEPNEPCRFGRDMKFERNELCAWVQEFGAEKMSLTQPPCKSLDISDGTVSFVDRTSHVVEDSKGITLGLLCEKLRYFTQTKGLPNLVRICLDRVAFEEDMIVEELRESQRAAEEFEKESAMVQALIEKREADMKALDTFWGSCL